MSSYPAIAGEIRKTAAWHSALNQPVTLGVLLACLTFFFSCLRFSDPDTWWHLKAGQEIWQSRSIPTADHWSFTVSGNPWTPHEWLSEITIYLAYAAAGWQGLQLWMSLLSSAFVVAVYALCYRYCGRAYIAAFGGFLAFFFGTIGFSVRPQVLGYLFLALELVVLEQAWRGRPKLLWLLPPMFAVWVNCHGSYALGLAILGLATLCSACACYWPTPTGGSAADQAVRPTFRLATGALLASAVALFLNPVGFRLLLYPFDVFVHQRAGLGFVTEWLPVTIQDVRGVGLFLVLAALGIAGLTNRFKATVFELLLLAVFSALALQHLRMLFVFGIVSAPIVSRMLAAILPPRKLKPGSFATNALLIFAAIACCWLAFPRVDRIEADIAASNPVQAVEFIRTAALKGPMLNDYKFGGYLIWALPEYKVFIDGRSDVFDWAGVLAKYRDWALLETDPAKLLDDYGINFCLIPSSGAMFHTLPHLRGWKQVYRDDVAAVFVREPKQ